MSNSERWLQVDKIFHEVLDLEPHERERILDRACAGDSSLRKEVEALIHSRKTSGSFPASVSHAAAPASAAIAGRTFGSYEVKFLLGSGGMGDVYRARDSKLKRDVALKVLPDAFSCNADRVARFQREAEVLASLNHPHIAAIYDLATFGDLRFLVLELVEGETLAERLQRGPIPIEQALALAKQIAEAMEVAHDKGIIHRDLKPANIKIAPDSHVKVLDFGLSKVIDTEGADLSNAPTNLTTTMPGMIMGTAAYMSPEQAQGKDADRTSDIWAFGCVLYEMLAGCGPFNGETATEILAGVLKTEPDWKRLPPDTPEGIRRLLRRCLEKDQKLRFRDIRDARLEINDAQCGPPLDGREAERAFLPDDPDKLEGRRKHRSYIPWSATAIAMTAALAMIVFHFRRPPSPTPPVLRYQIPYPEGRKPSESETFAFSPDGTTIAFPTLGAGGPSIWLQTLNSLEPRLLVGADAHINDSLPFWTADSKSLILFSEGQLKKADLSGGALQPMCKVPGLVLGGSENRSGVFIFGTVSPSGIMKFPAGGGTCVSVMKEITNVEERHIFPFFLPDGNHFLYLSFSPKPEDNGLFVGSLDAASKDQHKRILSTNTAAEFVPGPDGSGQILFLRDGSLLAQEFDVDRLEVKGDPRKVVEGVGNTRAFPYFASSLSGNLIYRAAPAQSVQMMQVDRNGQQLKPAGPPIPSSDAPILNPFGTQFVVSRWEAADRINDLFLHTLTPYQVLRLTRGPSLNESPIWSADGTRVAYASRRSGHYDLYQTNANGDGQQTVLLESSENKFPESWSHDGNLLYSTTGISPSRDLWILPPGGKPFPFLTSSSNEVGGKFSPDGHWIIYLSDESGVFELYVRKFTPAVGSAEAVIGPRIPVSTSGAIMAFWRADGREVLYTAPNGDMMSVPVTLGATFHAGQTAVLFRAPNAFKWAAAPDGQSFLFGIPAGQQGITPFTVVLNWQSSFKNELAK